jgi:tetratricopeptide (TPR) repeat protein
LIFFNESLIKNPNDVEILVNKGSALGKLGYFSEAIVYYDHAIRIDPDFLPAKNNKANALANLGDFKDAVSLYGEVLEQNPNYLTARANLEIILSSNIDISSNYSEFGTENISNQKSLESEKIFLENSEKQNSSNFFDEIGNLFSTLSSLFGLQN